MIGGFAARRGPAREFAGNAMMLPNPQTGKWVACMLSARRTAAAPAPDTNPQSSIPNFP
ncbi:hypothetical protein [Tahibacter harae]|uniref:Uncharacterized protein n=1 Tax=Tahibacter harae TaxID=2963937 RepID=A0ABT1QSD0_9GAMM|nr:hypothetical protein [Tahibacter harae]MCQ4165190.1 hypothetical protein [Tahibacter harae]